MAHHENVQNNPEFVQVDSIDQLNSSRNLIERVKKRTHQRLSCFPLSQLQNSKHQNYHCTTVDACSYHIVNLLCLHNSRE